MKKNTSENQITSKFLEDINQNVIRLTQNLDALIDVKKTTPKTHRGRLLHVVNVSNHKMPAPNNPNRSANKL